MNTTSEVETKDEVRVPRDLQEGWCGARLSEVGLARLGKTPRRKDYRDSGRHRIIKFRDLKGNGVDFSVCKAGFVVDEPKALQGLRPLNAGDTLVTASAHSGDQIGKKCAFVHQLPSATGGVFFVGELLGITPNVEIVDKWPYLWFLSEDGIATIQGAVAGVHLTSGRAQDIVLPLAPPDEQKRIVAKVEELLDRLHAARERLDRVPAILKRFRQAVLAATCSGRLTADWRAEQGQVETANELVTRTTARRKTQYEEACQKAKAEGSKLPRKPANLEPRKVEATELPQVPEEWAWVYLPDLGYMNRGKSRHRPRNAPHLYGGPYPFIQTGDIAQSGGRIQSHRQTYSGAGLAQSRLWPTGTVSVTIAANIANSAILNYPACFPDSVVGVIPDGELCASEYLQYFVQTARANLEQFAPATAQKNINIEILSDVAVPLPPQAEQHEIVHRVEALFKLADTIEKRVVAATARAEKLTQAILAKAFRGELVPTEAELARREGRDYESASALLARIRAERAAASPSTVTRQKRERRTTRPRQQSEGRL